MSIKSKAKRDRKQTKNKRVQKSTPLAIKDQLAYWFYPKDFGMKNVIRKIDEIRKRDPEQALGNAKLFDITDIEPTLCSESILTGANNVSQAATDLSDYYKRPIHETEFIYHVIPRLEFIAGLPADIVTPDVILPYEWKSVGIEHPFGFPTFDNCIFVGNYIITHAVRQWHEAGLDWWESSMWTSDDKYIGCICGTKDSDTSIQFNPLNSFLLASPKKTMNASAHVGISLGFQIALLAWSLINNRPQLEYTEATRINQNGVLKFGNEDNTIIIDITHKNLKRTAPNPNSVGIKKRYHAVRGHIRRLQSGKIVTVAPHYRGDKSLGIIESKYTVEDSRKVLTV